MYYVVNVTKYLKGESYFKDTLYSDIDKTLEAFVKYCPNNLTQDCYSAFFTYYQLKQADAKRFADFMLINDIPYEYSNLLNHYYLPFRYSRDPIADKKIFTGMFNIFYNMNHKEDLRMDEIIFILLGPYQDPCYSSKEFVDRMYEFFIGGGIDFSSISNNYFCFGNIGYMPRSVEQIISDYQMYRNNKKIDNATSIVGNYGELMYYRYLQSINQLHQVIMWVSHDLGDGFGYDIAVYDAHNNKLIVNEVKATDNDNYFEHVSLTEHERNVANALRESPDTDYHIIRIGLGDKIQMVDINTKTDTAPLDLMEPGRQRILVNKNYEYHII